MLGKVSGQFAVGEGHVFDAGSMAGVGKSASRTGWRGTAFNRGGDFNRNGACVSTGVTSILVPVIETTGAGRCSDYLPRGLGNG
jgi:hypothetical protein